MGTILDDIVASKRRELDQARTVRSEQELENQLGQAPPLRDFQAALRAPGAIRLITEVKKASPSAGIIRADFDPVAIALRYAAHQAAAISVLTDRPYFQGSLSYLTAIRAQVDRPLLRKDFILDRYQILEARIAGADAVLLIAEILDDASLARLLRDTRALGMEALVELHDAENLNRVLDSGASIVGINNRDLRSFTTRLEHTLELVTRVPKECCVVSESGIHTRQDVLRLQAAGVKAILVGESIMKSKDMGAKIDELLGRN